MPTSAEIAAQLAEAVKTDSESATEETTETEKETKAEAKSDSEKTVETSEKETKEAKSEDESKETDTQKVPYERFKAKVDKVSDLEKELEKVNSQLKDFSNTERELQQKLSELEGDHTVLEKIRELEKDERYHDLVHKLDRAVRGIEEEVEDGKKTEEEAEGDVSKLMQQHRKELEEAISKKHAEAIGNQAVLMAERMLEALPDRYNESDRNALADKWNQQIPWDQIEKDPTQMKDILVDTFKSTVEGYGQPRGELLAKIKELETKPEPTQEEVQQTAKEKAEEEIQALLDDEEWSKVKTSEDGKFLGPVKSDQDFEDAIKKVLRGTA